MYKLLLCWRYLRTRYIALASIISVTLGVATMIVVNSVMAGFSHEMEKRIQGILSDVVFEVSSLNGLHDADAHMKRIERVAGEYIAGMTPTVHVPAMLSFRYGGQWVTRPVQVVGIDVKTKEQAGDYARFLNHPENRKQPSFDLRAGGYDLYDHQAGAEAPPRPELAAAGKSYRQWRVRRERALAEEQEHRSPENDLMRPATPVHWPEEEDPQEGTDHGQVPLGFSPPALLEDTVPIEEEEATLSTALSLPPDIYTPIPADPAEASDPAALASDPLEEGAVPEGTLRQAVAQPADPFAGRPREGRTFNPEHEQYAGLVMGFALATYRGVDGADRFMVLPGDDVKLTLPTAGTPPRAIDDTFTVVDLYESKMNEYDSSFVFVPIEKLQRLRGMFDPQTGIGNVNSIQIRLKDPSQADFVRDLLRNCGAFPPGVYLISTWKDKQGPLLAAVQMETAILNVLLFLIIAVAGFGILAIFFMIVVEKTRDIGILKSLGASGWGVMGIFLRYGLSLGIVGSGVGMALGLFIVSHINEVADVLSWITGHQVFDPTIYYFMKIPTIVSPFTVGWIVGGALTIAILASVLPALRAARLHPVEALRYE